MATDTFNYTPEFIRRKTIGYMTFAAIYTLLAVLTTILYLRRIRRAAHESLWLNLIHIVSALLLAILFCAGNAFRPHFPCFLNLWLYHIFGLLWVFSFIARNLRFLFQYEYHQAKLRAPTLDNQLTDLRDPAGLDADPGVDAKAPSAFALVLPGDTNPASATSLKPLTTTTPHDHQQHHPLAPPPCNNHSPRSTEDSSSAFSSSSSFHLRPPSKWLTGTDPGTCALGAAHSETTRRWWSKLSFQALVQRIPWMRKRVIFSETYMIRTLACLLCALFVYLVFVQTYSTRFAATPVITTQCDVAFEYAVVIGIMGIHVGLACPLFLFWIWGMDEAFGLRREIILEIVIGEICFGLFLITFWAFPNMFPYFTSNMFLLIGFSVSHLIIVVNPLGLGQDWIYMRKSGTVNEQDIAEPGEVIFVGRFKKKPSLCPSDIAATGLAAFLGGRRDDDAELSTFQSQAFTDVLRNVAEFEVLKQSAAKCFSTELILFLEDYQCLKHYTLVWLQRDYQLESGNGDGEVSAPPSPVRELPALPPPADLLNYRVDGGSGPATPAADGPQPNSPGGRYPPKGIAKPPIMRLFAFGSAPATFLNKLNPARTPPSTKPERRDVSEPYVTILETIRRCPWAQEPPPLSPIMECEADDEEEEVTKLGLTTDPLSLPANDGSSGSPRLPSLNLGSGDGLDAILDYQTRLDHTDHRRNGSATSSSRFSWSDESANGCRSASDRSGSAGSVPARSRVGDNGDDEHSDTGEDVGSASRRTLPRKGSAQSARRSPTAVPKKVHALYFSFYRRYIVPESDFAVNLPAVTIDAIDDAMRDREYTVNMFDPALREVLNLLFENVYPNYLRLKNKL